MPIVLHQVFARVPGVPPIAGCVLALFPTVLLSHITQGNADEALAQGIEFFKVLVYFLLMLALLMLMPVSVASAADNPIERRPMRPSPEPQKSRAPRRPPAPGLGLVGLKSAH